MLLVNPHIQRSFFSARIQYRMLKEKKNPNIEDRSLSLVQLESKNTFSLHKDQLK